MINNKYEFIADRTTNLFIPINNNQDLWPQTNRYHIILKPSRWHNAVNSNIIQISKTYLLLNYCILLPEESEPSSGEKDDDDWSDYIDLGEGEDTELP